jgi:DNA primase
MSRRFSPRQLTYLRNQVPISRVIEALSGLAVRHDGKLHFKCPLCHAVNTSVNIEPNLARCFDCRKNFNPIELVMHQRQISFVESVKWLMQRTAGKPVVDLPATDKCTGHPTAVGDILDRTLVALIDKKNDNLSESVSQRVMALERSVTHLYRLIDELRSSLTQK